MTVVLLKGLTSNFENYRQALQLQTLGFNQVVESLKVAETSISNEPTSTKHDSSANRASVYIRCYGCNKRGHLKKDCPEVSNDSSSEDDKKRTRKTTKAAKQFGELKKQHARLGKEIAAMRLNGGPGIDPPDNSYLAVDDDEEYGEYA